MLAATARSPTHLQHDGDPREQQTNAFWQAKINEGREIRRQEAEREKKLAELPPPPQAIRDEPNAAPAAEAINPLLTAISPDTIAILDTIHTGLPDGRRFSPAAQAGDRAGWRVIQAQIPGLSETEAQAAIDYWLQIRILEAHSYHDPIRRKPRLGLFRVTRHK